MNDTITTELRAAMNVDCEYTMGGDVVARMYCMGRDEFANLCDAIDAVHANLERENASLHRKLAEWAERGVLLPLDADGVPIRAGDKLDGYGKTIEVVEIRYGRSGWVLVSREGNAYADTFAFSHYAPTVEDVLLEMLYKAHIYDEREMELLPDLIAEYAAKLRLAGDGA